MKIIWKRLLLIVMVFILAGSVVLPGAMASKTRLISNGKSIITYIGMRTQLTITDGDSNDIDVRNYSWMSSKPAVASVNGRGIITAKKVGTTTITATNIYDTSERLKLKVTVHRNRYWTDVPYPSKTSASYKNWRFVMRSIEVTKPTEVVVEYYLVVNFPKKWRATKLSNVYDNIDAYDEDGTHVSKLLNGRASKISGFRSQYGQFVQTVKVTFNGSRVENTNMRISGYDFDCYARGTITYRE